MSKMYDNITGRSPIATDDLGYIGTGNKASDILNNGTTDYNDLNNKPTINDVELKGNLTSSDLGLQPELTEAQTNAVNSGITAALTEQIDTNKNNISTLATAVSGGVTWSTGYEPTSSNISIKQYGDIVYMQIYALFSADLPTSAETEIATITGVGKPATAVRMTGGVASTSLSDAPTALFQAFISASTNKLLVRTGATTGKAIYLNVAYVVSQ